MAGNIRSFSRCEVASLLIMQAMLTKVPILAGLDEAALNLLGEHIVESRAAAGSVIVREGDEGNCVFLIGEGSVRVCKHFGQPDEFELGRLGPCDFFGEMCVLETLPRSATVQAISDTTLYSLSSLTFYRLYEALPRQHSILIVNIARDLSRRLRHWDEIIAARR